ncbi:MAG: signal recognition particle-docking protein FtsY [Eubacteriales bacterium]|nr:signal recognition particle-docking protein FtsY [Eubacteriales bacterium]MDY5346715.1 signal recognition particle-docking protein FtsY [Eubacteriales bacterium]
MGFFEKIKQGLKKTKDSIGAMLSGIFFGRRVDEALMEELEEVLILADLGVECTERVMTELRARVRDKKIEASEDVRNELRDILKGILAESGGALKLDTKPSIILVIGVNGVGKTTTIGKLAGNLTASGKSVLLAAGDTFRAAAAEQLTIWAQRANASIVARGEGADPASVIFDAIQAGKARGTDVIICDTAGRLHNKSNLMNELAKIDRIINRELPDADKEVLLVIDATTGQNGLIQANEFKNVAGVTGLVLTKLDGTAKGGIAIAIAASCGLPIRYVGVGEQMDDLMPFQADQFVDALI